VQSAEVVAAAQVVPRTSFTKRDNEINSIIAAGYSIMEYVLSASPSSQQKMIFFPIGLFEFFFQVKNSST